MDIDWLLVTLSCQPAAAQSAHLTNYILKTLFYSGPADDDGQSGPINS